MVAISNSEIKVQQRVMLIISGIMFFLFGYTWFSNQNIETLKMLIVGFLIMGLINFVNLKLNEIYIDKDRIFIKNIMKDLIIENDQFEIVKTTLVSPFIYFIELKDSQKFYFIPKSDFLIKNLLVLEYKKIIIVLNETIQRELGKSEPINNRLENNIF